jgi:hypothetical protein
LGREGFGGGVPFVDEIVIGFKRLFPFARLFKAQGIDELFFSSVFLWVVPKPRGFFQVNLQRIVNKTQFRWRFPHL